MGLNNEELFDLREWTEIPLGTRSIPLGDVEIFPARPNRESIRSNRPNQEVFTQVSRGRSNGEGSRMGNLSNQERNQVESGSNQEPDILTELFGPASRPHLPRRGRRVPPIEDYAVYQERVAEMVERARIPNWRQRLMKVSYYFGKAAHYFMRFLSIYFMVLKYVFMPIIILAKLASVLLIPFSAERRIARNYIYDHTYPRKRH